MHPYKLGGWNEETVQVFFGIIRCLLSLKEIFYHTTITSVMLYNIFFSV